MQCIFTSIIEQIKKLNLIKRNTRELKKMFCLKWRISYHIQDLFNVKPLHGSWPNFKDYANLFSINAKICSRDDIIKDLISPKKQILINSLLNCEAMMKRKKSFKKILNGLIQGENNSFAIIPLGADKHVFAAIIRKQNNQEFNVTVINKGKRGLHAKVIEYKMHREKLLEMYQEFCFLSPGGGMKHLSLNIDKAYEYFAKNSTTTMSYGNIGNRDQAFGNCYFKEMEFAIKCAIATRNEDFSYYDKQLHIENTKLKWPIKTDMYHKLYVEELLKKYENRLSKSFINSMHSYLNFYLKCKDIKLQHKLYGLPFPVYLNDDNLIHHNPPYGHISNMAKYGKNNDRDYFAMGI